MNEENVKIKVILPFIKELGFDISEVSFEESFSIKLGRTTHCIKKSINGRLDILCRRNGKNLFIIEVKNDSISIDDDDITQGISYARSLLDDIAPFVIITNGKTTRIFDSISKRELTGKNISEHSDFWKSNYTLSLDEELRIRYEALKNFISFSSENLKLFCEKQVQERMGTIIGDIDSSASKFVKELFCERENLQKEFKEFVSSDAKIFGIVGVAGVGKTNAICSLALQSLKEKFVFFYNASILSKSPLEHVADDLNLVFSSKNERGLVLKKLDELGRLSDKDILLFIDAIDESRSANISLELSEIALACRNLEKIKVCISCKSDIWKNIIKPKGEITHLYEELSKSHKLIINDTPGFLLEDFTEEELEKIIPLYKDTFGLKGDVSKELLEELKNGFFLRIFSEVYSNKQIPEKSNDKELISKYIKQSLEKTDVGFHTGVRILSEIGKILLKNNYTRLEEYYDSGLDVDDLLEKLNFSLHENLPEDLFSRNILIKSNKDDSYNINFYYSKIRDYIICFHSYKLDKLNDKEFYSLLEEFYENYIGRSAIDFYIENACFSHKFKLMEFKKTKAIQYVNIYNKYLEENFKNFKDKFDPYTNGEIGIILNKDLLNSDGYALFDLKLASKNKLRLEDLKDIYSDSNIFYKLGINTIYGSYEPLLVKDQNKVAKKNIFKDLKKIIDEGKLTSYNSDELLLEQLSLILYFYHKQLGYNWKLDDFYLPRLELIYPIDLKELQDRIYRFRALFHYTKRERLPPHLVEEKIETALKSNLEIPKLTTVGDFPPFEELFKIVNILLVRGYKEIKNHHLPYPDKSVFETEEFYSKDRSMYLHKVRACQYSSQQAKLYIEQFFSLVELSYQKFIDENFPKLKTEFSFYMNCPHEYFFYMKDSNVLKWGRFGYRKSNDGIFKINFMSEKSYEEAFENVSTLYGFSFDQIIHNDYSDTIKTIYRINTKKVDEFCVLRSWIYRILKRDLEKLFKENKE